MKYITAISDASWANRRCGYAVFVRDKETIVKRSISVSFDVDSSVEAELMALCHAILIAADEIPSEPGDIVVAQSDCIAAVEVFTRPEFNHRPVFAAMRDSVVSEVRGLGLKLRLKHVKGHTTTQDGRSFVNRWCDAEAKKARRGQTHCESATQREVQLASPKF